MKKRLVIIMMSFILIISMVINSTKSMKCIADEVIEWNTYVRETRI